MLYYKYPRRKVPEYVKKRLKKTIVIQTILVLIFLLFMIFILEHNYHIFTEEELLYSEGKIVSIEHVKTVKHGMKVVHDTYYYLLTFDDGNIYYVTPRNTSCLKESELKNSEKPTCIKYISRTRRGGYMLADLKDDENTYFSMDEINHKTKMARVACIVLIAVSFVIFCAFNIFLFRLEYTFKAPPKKRKGTNKTEDGSQC